MIFWLLTQAQDSSRADIDASVSDVGQCLQSFVICPRCNDGRIVLPAGVQVVVVCCESSFFQLFGLDICQYWSHC